MMASYRMRSIPLLLLPLACLILGGCGVGVVETTWAPNGEAIAYGEGGALRVQEVGAAPATVTTAPGQLISPAWSPGGDSIAFYLVATEGKAAASLCCYDLAGKVSRTLVDDVWSFPASGDEDDRDAALAILALTGAISWHPDGRQLACVSATPEGGRILLADRQAGATRPVLEIGDILLTLAWSPDGQMLAYVQSDRRALAQETTAAARRDSLWVCSAADGSRQKVCDLPRDGVAIGSRLEWSADSGSIGCIVADGAYPGRAVACLAAASAGSPLRRVIPAVTPLAAWSPGLAGVAFVEERDPGPAVALYISAAPRSRRVLGSLPGAGSEASGLSCSQPVFSPTGRRLALRAGPDDHRQLVVLDVP